MGERLLRVTGLELARALEQEGWEIVRRSGSHCHYRHPERQGVLVTVPVHAGKTLPASTQKGIMRDAELTARRLRELL